MAPRAGRRRKKLSAACAKEVFRTQEEVRAPRSVRMVQRFVSELLYMPQLPLWTCAAADEGTRHAPQAAIDFRSDAELEKFCAADAKKLCSSVEPGEGRVQACLRENRHHLQWGCAEELFRQEIENADDIRLSIVLLRTCNRRQAEVLPRRAARCVIDKAGSLSLGHCWASWGFVAMDGELGVASVDGHMPILAALPGPQGSCIEMLFCHRAVPRRAAPVKLGRRPKSRVKQCLEDHRNDDGFGAACRAELEAVMVHRAADFRLDAALRDACEADIEKVCGYEKVRTAAAAASVF